MTSAFGGVQGAENIELVQRRKDDKKEVPHHKYHAVFPVQFPMVHMSGSDQEHNGGQKRKSRVRQT